MVDTLTGKSPDKLEELFSNYEDLKKRRQGLEERLHKAEREKDSVSERIYEKVIRGYEDTLGAVNSELAPIQSQIDEFKREAERELADLEQKLAKKKDDLAEAGFRNRVGEYDNDRYEEITAGIENDLEMLTSRRNEIVRRIEPFGTGKSNGEAEPVHDGLAAPPAGQEKSHPGKNDSQPESTPHLANTGKRAGHEPAVTEPRTAPDFENPQEWLDELGRDKKPSHVPPPGTRDSMTEDVFFDDDPLSALADPSSEDRSSGQQNDSSKTPMSYPNLVINTGPNTGKKIPLLPMTMSIGREHDNNIELKDPDVARYHARILYERGEFLLEDLESSTGSLLNGTAVKKAKLANGDKIRFGSTELTVEFD